MLLLASKRVSREHLVKTVEDCKKWKAALQSGHLAGQPEQELNARAFMSCLPILRAEKRGDQRWCTNCLCVNLKRNMQRCSGCGSVAYCGEKCAKIHWKKGGHKAVCKAIRAGDAAGGDGGGGEGGRNVRVK